MRNIIIIIFVLIFSPLVSQNVEFNKENIGDKRELRKAKKLIKKGDKELFAKSPNYYNAYLQYIEANKINPDNAALNYKIGKSLYNIDKIEAHDFFLKSLKLQKNKTDIDNQKIETLFYIAEIFHYKEQFDSAIKYFNKILYAYPINFETKITKSRVNKHIQQCKNAKEHYKKPLIMSTVKFNEPINEGSNNFFALIAEHESENFYFNTDRDNSVNSIYYAELLVGGKYSVTKNNKLNGISDKAILTDISSDGNYALFIKNDEIYYSAKDEGEWSELKDIGSEVNSGYNQTFACFSFDMSHVYFVSDTPEESLGGKDIYKAEIYITRTGELKGVNRTNLGGNINSPYDEIFVAFGEYGNKMYVASNNEKSIGGFDIFKSINIANQWTELENLGYPLNTTKDEIAIEPVKDNLLSYVTLYDKDKYYIKRTEFKDILSELIYDLNPGELKSNSYTDDLASLKIKQEINISSYVMNTVSGCFYDADTKEPLSLKIDIINNKTLEVVASFKTQAKTGMYSISLPTGIDYGLIIKNKEYLYCPEEIHLPGTSSFQYINKDFYLNNIATEKSEVLKNISFIKDSHILNEESSKGELFRIIKILNNNENIRMLLVGPKNKLLSILDYMYNKGINEDRIVARYSKKDDDEIIIKFSL